MVLTEQHWEITELLKLNLNKYKPLEDKIYQLIFSTTTDKAIISTAEVVRFVYYYYFKHYDEDKHLHYILKLGIEQARALKVVNSYGFIRYTANDWFQLFPEQKVIITIIPL